VLLDTQRLRINYRRFASVGSASAWRTLDAMVVRELETPHGTARAHVAAAAGAPRATLVLGHGAGGSITAPDLQAVAAAVVEIGVRVVLVEQPYRVAGRRSAAPARQLDAAWLAVIEQLDLHGAPLITGGRSSGARVACRTAAATGSAGVLCLAFPLVTPKGVSRQDELDAVRAPLLVVQGTNDRFGMPEPDLAARREVVQVSGDHGLKRDLDVVATAVTGWLGEIVGSEAP
jgi:predicted alpha/beta-hydrolase family hydrolase